MDIDAKVLNFYTKISHNFQRRTMRTNFYLAKYALIMTGLAPIIIFAGYWFPIILLFKVTIIDMIASVGYLSYIVFLMDGCDKVEEHFLDTGKLISLFRLKLFCDKSLRYAALASSIFFVVTLFIILAIESISIRILPATVFIVGMLSLTSFLYFIKVIPLPPAKKENKVRNLVHISEVSL